MGGGLGDNPGRRDDPVSRSMVEDGRIAYTDYYLPRLRRSVAPASKIRILYATITAVAPDVAEGVAEGQTEDGTTVVFPWRDIEPVEGMHWRAMRFPSGDWWWDDQAPILDLEP